jgi:hypothetical protein
MQRHSSDASAYERRLESLNADLHSLRTQLSLREEVLSQHKLETDTFKEKTLLLEQELAKRIEVADIL